jgi:hypothetical protein
MKYGLNVTGKIRVFRKDKEIKHETKKVTFTISDVWFNISEQNEDGTYFNISHNLIFKKGLPLPENNTTIILEGFPMITGNGQYRKIAYYVNAWEYEVPSL